MNLQPLAYRKQGETEKALVTYDQSLRLLREAGYERHLRPVEAFTFLAEGLEGKLNSKHKKVHDDMLISYGEWLSMAFERQGNTLITYLDPEGLVWDGTKYGKERGFSCSKQKEFDITGKPSQTYLDLNLFDEQLVRYVYGRSFSDLPPKMKEGIFRAGLYLPPDNEVRPVGRGVLGGRFDVGGFGGGSVRGVASVGKKK